MFLLLILCSCKDEDSYDAIEVVFTPESQYFFEEGLNFSPDENEQKISFKTNWEWAVSLSDDTVDWCTVSPLNGNAGDASFTISVKANPSENERSTVINLSVGDIVKTLHVSQERAAIVEADSIKLSSESSVYFEKGLIFTEDSSQQMISFEKMEKVVVMDAIIACQSDVMVSRYALTQLQTRHHNGIIQQFDMADTGKRKLLRQIASEKLTARCIQIRIRYLLSNQDPPIKCGQQTKARRNRTDGLNTQTKFGERRPTVVSDKVVRMKRIIGHDGNPARREITPVKALKVCRDEVTEESFRADVVTVALPSEQIVVVIEIFISKTRFYPEVQPVHI